MFLAKTMPLDDEKGRTEASFNIEVDTCPVAPSFTIDGYVKCQVRIVIMRGMYTRGNDVFWDA
jgi:hypothetical protein